MRAIPELSALGLGSIYRLVVSYIYQYFIVIVLISLVLVSIMTIGLYLVYFGYSLNTAYLLRPYKERCEP